MRLRAAVAATIALSALSAGTVVGTSAPSYAVDNSCEGVRPDTPRSETARASVPLDLLDIERAQQVVDRYAAPLDDPVGVAVLDSGVAPAASRIPVIEEVTGTKGDQSEVYFQGTVVAGLIAGAKRADGSLVGIAPDAKVIDVRVYDDPAAGEDATTRSATELAGGLDWVARNAAKYNIRVATVAFGVPSSKALRLATARVIREGVVLVAATGDRPEEGGLFDTDFDDPPAKDEDGADVIFPAGYPSVVGVNSTAGGLPGTDLTSLVVKNSRTDVAAPTANGVSYGLNGSSCVVDTISTGWAAAEVSGVVALLWQMYPDDTSQQIVARLLGTASGTPDNPTPLIGVGVVQPYEALTRPLDPDPSGRVERAVVVPEKSEATAPEPAPDLLATTRDNAIWWGLIGGGLLVVALLLRPMLARRRD